MNPRLCKMSGAIPAASTVDVKEHFGHRSASKEPTFDNLSGLQIDSRDFAIGKGNQYMPAIRLGQCVERLVGDFDNRGNRHVTGIQQFDETEIPLLIKCRNNDQAAVMAVERPTWYTGQTN